MQDFHIFILIELIFIEYGAICMNASLAYSDVSQLHLVLVDESERVFQAAILCCLLVQALCTNADVVLVCYDVCVCIR